MKAVLAISGGVDSMVMLDIFRHDEIIVAHFNHGTRSSADNDMEFVRKMAEQKYGVSQVEIGIANLGEGVSEEKAREWRYKFLRRVAKTQPVSGEAWPDAEIPGATRSGIELPIYTAHHLDDLVESIAINLLRGTGWRGLAVLDAPRVRRPFLEPDCMPERWRSLVPFDKELIEKYAADFKIIYRQDPTNNQENYLRNRVREKLKNFDKKRELYDLWQKQKLLKREIDEIVACLLPEPEEPWQRAWFDNLDEAVAIELLRAGTLRAGISATRPQLENFRQAIMSYAPGKAFNLPKDRLVTFTKTSFIL